MQIAESVGGRRRIVRHVGSAHDEAELGLLMAQASKLLQDDAQGQLDLGLSLPVPWAAMVPAPAETLFGGTIDSRSEKICLFGGPPEESSRPVDGRVRRLARRLLIRRVVRRVCPS